MINQFNAALPTRIDAWNSAASPVVLVDQNSAINAATHLYDGVHPNSVGERQMADTWSNAIASVRPLRDSSGQFSSSNQTFFAVAVDRNGNSSVAKSFTLGERPNETPSGGGGGGGENGVSESERTFVGNAVGNHTLTHTATIISAAGRSTRWFVRSAGTRVAAIRSTNQ